MCSIKTVDKVRRESRSLFHAIHCRTIMSTSSQQQKNHKPSALAFGSEMYTDWIVVLICLRIIFLYGWTIGKPSGVVQITVVICSFLTAAFGILIIVSPLAFLDIRRRSSGMDLEMRRAQMLSHCWMCLAPLKVSPIVAITCMGSNVFNYRRGLAKLKTNQFS